MLQVGTQTSHLVITLAQLIGFCVATGAPDLSFYYHSRSTDSILCRGWSYKPLIWLSVSLNWLDSVLQLELQTSHFVVTLAQLSRFCIATGAPNLLFRYHSRSIDWSLCCNWSSGPFMLLAFSLNRFDSVLQLELQTSHVVVTLSLSLN